MSHRQGSHIGRVLLLCAILCFLPPAMPVQAAPPHRVLLLCSYNSEFQTYTQQRSGLAAALPADQAALDVEFMDAKRFSDDAYLQRFKALLSWKLTHSPPYDLVLIADDNALQFAMTNRKELFDELPMVFFGINSLKAADDANRDPLITGVVESVSMEETIALAARLQPQAKGVVALVDGSPSGQGDLATYRSMSGKFPSLTFSQLDLSTMDFQQFQSALDALGSDRIILLLSVYSDISGQTVSFQQGLDMIRSHVSVPVFHLWYHGIGSGCLGGKVISHEVQARVAGDMAMSILAGKQPASIPLVKESPNVHVFDDKELQRFGIRLSDLPEDAILLNRPESFLVRYRTLTFIVSGIFLFLCGILVMLVILLSVKRRDLAVIREGHRQLELEVAERRAAEEALILAREQAVAAGEAKANFLANMSHEIRTPMNGIIGMSELALLADTEAMRTECLKTVRSASQSLLRLINDILNYTRLDRQKEVLSEQPVRLSVLFDELAALFSAMIRNKGLQLNWHRHASIPDTVLVDRVKLHEILSNLIGNAVKFTPFGRIDVYVDRFELADSTQEGLEPLPAGRMHLCFRVCDTGIGIPPAHLEDIFDRFQQVQPPGVDKQPGTGLGLAIVKKIVALMDGWIDVTSREGVGSTFRFVVACGVERQE